MSEDVNSKRVVVILDVFLPRDPQAVIYQHLIESVNEQILPDPVVDEQAPAAALFVHEVFNGMKHGIQALGDVHNI